MDMCYLNDSIAGYLIITIERSVCTEDDINDALCVLGGVLDDISADDAENYAKEWVKKYET